MLAVTKFPDSFRLSIDALAGVLVDSTMRISPAGFDIRQLDSAGSTFVALSFPRDKWDVWTCVEHGHYGVNIPSLAKVLKTARNAKEIRIEIKDKANMLLTAVGACMETNHTVNLLDYTINDFKVPDIDYPLEFDLNVKTFKRVIRDLGSLADHVTLRQVQLGIEFVASGPFTEQRVLLPKSEYLAFLNDGLNAPTGPYSLRILSLFTRAAADTRQPTPSTPTGSFGPHPPGYEVVRMRAKPGMPLVLEYCTALGAVLFATAPV